MFRGKFGIGFIGLTKHHRALEVALMSTGRILRDGFVHPLK